MENAYWEKNMRSRRARTKRDSSKEENQFVESRLPPEEDNSQFLAPRISTLLWAWHSHVSSVISLSLSFGVKISDADIFSILQHCPLKWDICFISAKKSHMWSWYVGLGITWGTWFWARYSDQIVTWPTSVRSKECTIWVGERTKMAIGWPKYWVAVDTHSLISSS